MQFKMHSIVKRKGRKDEMQKCVLTFGNQTSKMHSNELATYEISNVNFAYQLK